MEKRLVLLDHYYLDDVFRYVDAVRAIQVRFFLHLFLAHVSKRVLVNHQMACWPNGKASDYESGDCRFEPCVGHSFCLFFFFNFKKASFLSLVSSEFEGIIDTDVGFSTKRLTQGRSAMT